MPDPPPFNQHKTTAGIAAVRPDLQPGEAVDPAPPARRKIPARNPPSAVYSIGVTASSISLPPGRRGQRRRFAAAYSVLERAIQEGAFPGAAFGVLSDRQVLALDGVGRFTYEPRSNPVAASTIYDLASVTKVIATTAMAMLLHQRGRLQLDRPLADLLPRFAQGEAERRRVTLRTLLAHSSGLPGYVRLYETCPDPESLVEACLRLPLGARPGERAEYSDPGFILLGKALEEIAGESLEAFCAREVFTPLHMTGTGFRPPSSRQPAIPPTEIDEHFRHRIIQGEVQDENCFVLGGVAGHAGLFSNALDSLRFAGSILAATPGEAPAGIGSAGCSAEVAPLFSTETVTLFTTRAEPPSGSSRALGWDTPSRPSSSGRYFRPHSAGHLGYAGTSLWIDLERRIAVVLLTNRTWPRRGNDAIRRVRPAFHDAILEAVLERPIR